VEPPAGLPFVDAHTRVVAAPAVAVWRAVERFTTAGDSPAVTAYGRLVGVRGGRGFHVGRSEPPRRLELVGGHRFATYSLVFTVDDVADGRSVVRAETRAAFPGVAGRLYRALVVDSRAHALIVRRMLAGIARRAERAPA